MRGEEGANINQTLLHERQKTRGRTRKPPTCAEPDSCSPKPEKWLSECVLDSLGGGAMFSSMTDDDMSTCFSAPAAADGPGDEANGAGRRPAEAELPEEVA